MNTASLRNKAARLRATADAITKAAALCSNPERRAKEQAEAEGLRSQANELDVQANQLEATEGL